MRLLVIILIVFSSFSLGLAQQNPFDLKYNLPNTTSNNVETHQVDSILSIDSTQQAVSSLNISTDYFESNRDGQVFRFWYFPLLAIFLVFVINLDRNSISKLFKSVTNLNFLNLMYRDQRNRYRPQYILYGILSVLSAAYFMKQALIYFTEIDISIFKMCLIIATIYLIRHIVMGIISFTFPKNSEINQYSYTIFIFNIILGLLLLILNPFIAFSSPSIAKFCIYIGTFIIITLYAYRGVRGLLLSSNLILRNKFRFIMYICTLEIAPIFLIISIFRQF